MHVVVMGCGRVGSQLARTLDSQGHSVAVIDQERSAFTKLGKQFGGQTVVGVGFDRDRLIAAGVEDAHAFAAVSSGDNSNIISARVARETFGVEIVVARIYDPRRAEVYQRLGIPTVASVSWQADRILRQIVPPADDEEWRADVGEVTMREVVLPDSWVGERVTRLERESGARVAYLLRQGRVLLPGEHAVIQADDEVHLLVVDAIAADSLAVVAAGPERSAS